MFLENGSKYFYSSLNHFIKLNNVSSSLYWVVLLLSGLRFFYYLFSSIIYNSSCLWKMLVIIFGITSTLTTRKVWSEDQPPRRSYRRRHRRHSWWRHTKWLRIRQRTRLYHGTETEPDSSCGSRRSSLEICYQHFSSIATSLASFASSILMCVRMVDYFN